MLEKYKWKRIPIEKVLNHPWLRQMDFPNFVIQIYRPEEIKYIKEEFNFRDKQLNKDIKDEEDLIRKLINEWEKKDEKEEEDDS